MFDNSEFAGLSLHAVPSGEACLPPQTPISLYQLTLARLSILHILVCSIILKNL